MTPLRLRVGVNTGEAVIAASGEDEGRVTGDTVNTAARLQTAAPAGGVLIGPTTALGVADAADLDDPVALELKGKAEPLSARVVRGFRYEPSREQAMGELRAPTIGRRDELEELRRALTDALTGRSLRRVVIAPPGVGKSRLLREFEDGLARERTCVWRARAKPDSTSVLEPIAGLLLSPLGPAATDRTASEALLRERLSLTGVADLRAEVVADAALNLLWPPEGIADSRPTEDRETLFKAWLDALDALAGDRPQVWLIEDVHWAGTDVLAFIDLAGERTASAGRLVVVTARPSLLESNPDWPGEARAVMQLSTLETTHAADLVRALVGEALPADLVARIAERSDGNCLFIEELLRSWVSVATLARDEAGTGWRLAVPAEDVPLPQSVQSIYAAQLDDLPPDARRLARRASVAGRRFPVRALEALDADKAGLETLQRRALVAGPIVEPLLGDAFSYRHALLRDAGYASLARAERARLHVRLGRWLEQAAGERQNEIAEQIAGHYSSALESVPALAPEVGEGLDRAAVQQQAADWYERAGQTTLSLAAHDAARHLLRRSIDLTPDDARLDQARRWERLGDATAFAADMEEGAAAYQRAIDLYRLAMPMASTAGVSGVAEGAAELREGAHEIQEEKRQFEREMAAAGLARATFRLSDVWYNQLRFAEARDVASRTIDELDQVDPASMARLLTARGYATLGSEGATPDARHDLERALEMANSTSDQEAQLLALEAMTTLRHEDGQGSADDWRMLGELATRSERWDIAVGMKLNTALGLIDRRPLDALTPLKEAREIAVARGFTEDAGWADYVESEAAFVIGDWNRAVDAGRRAMDVGQHNAYWRLTVRAVHVMVPIAAARGDRHMLERAAGFYRSLEGKFEFPDSPYSRIVRPAQDIELAAAGLMPAYVPEVDPGLDGFREHFTGASWTAAIDRVFRSWLEARAIGGAERALEAMRAAQRPDSDMSPLGSGTYELLRARMAEARAENDAAAESATEALGRFRLLDAHWWIAKAIRLLERVGAADYQLISEVFEIERRLGVARPTE